MELVYLWVKDYKNIKEQGFNFSSRFQCTYDKGNFKLTIDKNKNFISSFFGNKISVTGIIGENGSGKSSLLEILSNKYDTFDINNGLFFVFYDKNNDDYIFKGARVINIEDKTYRIELETEIDVLRSTKTIYFSNILNENDLYTPMFFQDVNYSYMVNISTTQVLSQMKYIDTESNHIMSSSSTSFDKVYRSYRIQQISNLLILLKDTALEIPFKIPDKIIIKSINFRDHIRSLQNKFKDEEFKNILDIINRSNSNETLFENYLKTNLIISLLLENMSDNNPIKDKILQEVLNKKMNSSLSEFYRNVRDVLTNRWFEYNKEYVNASYLDEFFKNADLFVEQMSQYNANDSYISEFEICLSVKNDNFNFLDTYEKLIQQSEYFLDISWRGISSGEESFLYEFSRFYNLSKGYKSNPNLNLTVEGSDAENLIVLIDEGETTFHPQWQKQYLKYIVEFFDNNFDQNIHLILTSHSPFLASDLPRKNILFLKNGKEERNIDFKQTFGANIHTLLSNGFFMQNGLMGAYAKDKIESVVDFLRDKESKIQSYEEASTIIDIIGEPILKMRLEQMLYEYKKQHKLETKEEIQKKIDTLLIQLSER